MFEPAAYESLINAGTSGFREESGNNFDVDLEEDPADDDIKVRHGAGGWPSAAAS